MIIDNSTGQAGQMCNLLSERESTVEVTNLDRTYGFADRIRTLTDAYFVYNLWG